jgi:membrane protein implicated in regulation of membrane protease activity
MSMHEILFGVPLLIGALLVLGLALGLADVSSELGPELAHEPGTDASDGALAALGLGRVPLGVLLMLLLLLFGGAGLLLYPAFSALMGAGLGLAGAWLIAAIASLLGTRVLGRAFVRLLPSVESYASTKPELVGQIGTVVVRVSPTDVVVRVRDRGGAELRVRGVFSGQAAAIGKEVLILEYERERDLYRVQSMALE